MAAPGSSRRCCSRARRSATACSNPEWRRGWRRATKLSTGYSPYNSDVHELVAVYERVVAALDARELAFKAAARAPRPAPGGRLLVFGLGKIAAEMCEGARGTADAIIV